MCLNLDGNEPLVAHWQGLRPDALPIVIILATVYFLPLIPNRIHATLVLAIAFSIQLYALHYSPISEWGLGPVALMLAFSALLRQRGSLTERSNFANHP